MKTQKDSEATKTKAAAECGATHMDCPNTWKGTCDREAGHDGSHHCSSCNSVF